MKFNSDINLANFYGSNVEEESINPIGEKILLFQQALNQNNESEIYRSDIFINGFEEIENYMAEEKLTLSENILIVGRHKNIPL